MSANIFQENRNEVIDSLRTVYKKKIMTFILAGLMLTLSILACSITVGSILEIIFGLSTAGRFLLLSLSSILFLFVVSKSVLPYLLKYFRSPGIKEIKEIALEVGTHLPGIKDKLRNAVELMSSIGSPLHSVELAQAHVGRIFEEVSRLEITSAVKNRISRKTRVFFSVSMLSALSCFLLFPSQTPDALGRIIRFYQQDLSPYSIEVQPGDVQLSRGDTLRVIARIQLVNARKLPSTIVFNEKYGGESEFERHSVSETSGGLFNFQLANLRGSVDYFLSAGEQDTRVFHVKVVDPPIVRDLTVNLVYPAYTGKNPEPLQDNIGDLTALVGTRAEISVRANKDLKSAWISFNDSTSKALSVHGAEAAGTFIVERTSGYFVRLLDTDSLQNRDPILYSVQALKDAYPTCEIVYPGKDVDLNRDMQLPLRIGIGDDYGFTKLVLEYKLASSRYVQPEKDYRQLDIPLPSKSAGEEEVAYTWDLSSLDLVPEDVISYHARVFDNDLVHGPKSTVSREFQLRLPSLNEVFSSTDSEHSDLISKAENLLGKSDDMKEQLDKLAQDMKTVTQQMSWEEEKKTQNALERFQEFQQRIDSLREQVESLTQRMLENKVISPETLEKYLELQKAIKDLNSPEFEDALRKLQQAIQSLNPNQVRQAMQNLQVNEDALRQSIERTLSLIKRVETEQKFDELQKRVDQMLSQQEKVSKSTAESDSTDKTERNELSSDQKEVERQYSDAKDALSDLQKRMDEFSKEMPVDKVDQMSKNLDKSGVQQNMQNSENELSQGNFSQASGSQQQVENTLKEFQQMISQAQKEMLQNQQKATLNALQKAQQNLLEISKEQEDLRDKSSQSPATSPQNRPLAEKQNELMQELGYTAQQLAQLSNKSFAVTPKMGRQIGEAYAEMQEAMNDLLSRTSQNSSAEAQSKAMGAMNQAVMSIQNSLETMAQGQGSGGFASLMQQLQQLAGQQEGLNAQTQKLGENGDLSIEQQVELARLAGEQGAIRKSLSQLAQEAQQSAALGQQNRILGNLDQITKDMNDVIKDLQNNDINPETIQRQEKILSRMLDASRSINQRDFDNERKSSPGQDVVGGSPADLNLVKEKNALDEALIKLIRKNFPLDYQRIILRYYRIIGMIPE